MQKMTAKSYLRRIGDDLPTVLPADKSQRDRRLAETTSAWVILSKVDREALLVSIRSLTGHTRSESVKLTCASRSNALIFKS